MKLIGRICSWLSALRSRKTNKLARQESDPSEEKASQDIFVLIDKYLSDTATENEIALVEQWYEGELGKHEQHFTDQFLSNIKLDMKNHLVTYVEKPK